MKRQAKKKVVKKTAVRKKAAPPKPEYPEIDRLIKKIHPNGVPHKVAIVAMGSSSGSFMRLACNQGTRKRVADEVWAINSQAGCIQHDLLFHMDDCRVQEARAKRKPEANVAGMLTWLPDHPKFFTSKAYPEYKGAIEFPIEEVINKIGAVYFNNTVAYAVAWCIAIGVKHISMWGADYSYDNLHKSESGRGCVEFLLGRASAQGIFVEVSSDTTLLDANVPDRYKFYGFDAYDMGIERADGKLKIIKNLRDELPSPEEIERRYKHE